MKFSILAKFTGNMEDRGYELNLTDAMRVSNEAGLAVDDEPCEIGDSEYQYLSEEDSGCEWYDALQDIQASGIVSREQLEMFLDGLGAFAEDCETMGTLGGPLSDGMPYIVPDISFICESPILIECIRITPIPSKFEPNSCLTEASWGRTRKAMLSLYGS